MGRFWVDLDPAGYYRVTEPGLDFLFYGNTLAMKLDPDYSDAKVSPHNIFVPKGSEWAMCRPRQMTPNWHLDARMVDHVLMDWSFAPEIEGISNWEPTRTGDGTTYPFNQWWNLPNIPESWTSLDGFNFGAMGVAAGVNILNGTKTIGYCNKTPHGYNFAIANQAEGITPMFNWLQYPAPIDQFIFGFSNFAFITRGNAFYVLITPDGTGSSWELLWHGGLGTMSASGSPAAQFASNSGALPSVIDPGISSRGMMVVPVGRTHLWCYPGRSEPVGVPTRKFPDDVSDVWFKPGAMWIAAAPKQKINFQAQVVGYEVANSNAVQPPPVFIDLGENYTPSIAPSLTAETVMYTAPGTSVTRLDAGAGVVLDAPSTGCGIIYGLHNASGLPWVVGTDHRGSMALLMTPGNPSSDETGNLLSPQVRVIEASFPVVMVPRVNRLLRLDDTKYHAISALNFLYDPLGKRLVIDLLDAGLAELTATDHDIRGNFPVHFVEDTDDDDVPDTVRVAGWVTDIEVEELRYNDLALGHIVAYRIQALGLLEQANTKWVYLPQLTNPQSVPPGTISHTYAVARTLAQAGILTNSTTFFAAQVDPFYGDDITLLSGTWGVDPGLIGRPEAQNDWGPTWEQTMADYAIETGREHRGWVLYETMGQKLRYHEDLMRDVERGAYYRVSAQFYATTEGAVAAGTPRQKYFPGARRQTIEPKANIIRVAGDDDQLSVTPQVLEMDALSFSLIDYPHFLGSPKTYAPPPPKNGNDVGMMRILCRLLLEKKCRRRNTWTILTPISPWDVIPEAIDVGYVMRTEGKGDRLVTACKWDLITSRQGDDGVVRTQFVLMSLPDNATQGAGGGSYPGVGLPPS